MSARRDARGEVARSSSGRASPSRRRRAGARAIGLPTMLERPITTASRAARAATPASASRRITPSGVHGTKRGGAAPQAADVHRVEAVDVLRRDRSRRAPRCASSCGGSGSCTRMPSTRGSSLRRAHQRQQLGLRGGRRQLVVVDARRPPRAPPWSCCARRPARPGPHRPGPPPARARTPRCAQLRRAAPPPRRAPSPRPLCRR